MNAQFMKLVQEKAKDVAVQMRKEMHERYEGDAPGMHSLNDLEHRVWFEEMVKKDPLWPIALQFVDGGDREVRRYLRTVAKHEEEALGVQPFN